MGRMVFHTRQRSLHGCVLATLVCTAAAAAQQTQPSASDTGWTAVRQAMRANGSAQPGGVLKFGFPRGDLHVVADGVSLKAVLALGSWVAFRRDADDSSAVTVMGDLVLVMSEVSPVISALEAGGVEVTALHNHLLGETPRIMYLHIMGHGDGARMAEAIRRALALTGTPPAQRAPSIPQSVVGLDTAAIHRVLGRPGTVNGGVYQVGVPRAERITVGGREVPPSMGVATAINFQPAGAGSVAATGDFVMTPAEVNRVLRALRTNGIEVTALHSHMLEETPRLFFMHFWAKGDVLTVARGLRAALDEMAIR